MNREYYGKLIFELSHKGRKGYMLPKYGASDNNPLSNLPSEMLRSQKPELPEVDELTVVRHYTNMSNNNFGVDTGFYPLGSCTMKYNPKINEELASDSRLGKLHPYQPVNTVQGVLNIYHTLQSALSEIGGMAEFTLNPYAGAHGELTGLMIIRAYHQERNDTKRVKVIVPDSAHGTNPASAAVAGLSIVEVKSRPDGTVDVDDLRPLLDDTVAAVMMTNPNTLGIFEKNIPEIASLVHDCGALLYYDGANLNPLVGVARPGDMGFDVMHINLHKTFSTPHGGGGPGSGPVGVRKGLEHLLPNPRVVKLADGSFDVEYNNNTSGQVTGTLGNFAVIVRALAYIMTLGKEGLKLVGPLATLNATYIKEALKDVYLLPIDGLSKHEFVFDGLLDKSTGVTTLNVAKRLLDFGFHAPTIYFPLLFHESLMIEPTETESLETIDNFIAVMRQIAKEASENPDMVKNAPHNTPITHPDDTQAALHPIVTYSPK
ncbi:aminomethyl-transferring glycine dehydrogenase subunit GcvPB [Muribaculum caecicola]|uniref:Glycine dehydrogenase subunit 2 n=1 Tax=Muribaculum caecicola TaxID=3038144 RepID=A0AC61S868_9BACT|nr:aminomethyl-transferring glycine dehydrogenase subunit GcvPB [Muribaculum caecicola]THG54842.1 glycine dehydrogenase subunit 2 [Muribaculum caecicola]